MMKGLLLLNLLMCCLLMAGCVIPPGYLLVQPFSTITNDPADDEVQEMSKSATFTPFQPEEIRETLVSPSTYTFTRSKTWTATASITAKSTSTSSNFTPATVTVSTTSTLISTQTYIRTPTNLPPETLSPATLTSTSMTTSTLIIVPSKTASPTETPTRMQTPSTTPAPGCSPAFNTDFENQIADSLNQQRIIYGLPPLTLQSSLTAAARDHSEDMACNSFFSHIGSDGSTYWDRVSRIGYSAIWVGENIFAGMLSSPSIIVNWWMNSAPHRANILNSKYSSFGIGYVFVNNSPDQKYWTVNFASP